MSQSIYGVRMPGTLGDVINQLHSLRSLMSRRAEKLIATAIAQTAVASLDHDVIFGGERKNYLSEAYSEVRQRIKAVERDNTRDPEIDTGFDVVVCDDGLYAVMISFTEQSDWFEDLLSLAGAQDFSYWDGSDRPADVSAEEWSLRRRTYERILSQDPRGRPAGCGVTLSFLPPPGAPSIDLILSVVPSPEYRAEKISKEIMVSDWIAAQGEREISNTEYMSFFTSLTSPEIQIEISEKKSEILKRLPDVTLSSIKGTVDRENPSTPEF